MSARAGTEAKKARGGKKANAPPAANGGSAVPKSAAVDKVKKTKPAAGKPSESSPTAPKTKPAPGAPKKPAGAKGAASATVPKKPAGAKGAASAAAPKKPAGANAPKAPKEPKAPKAPKAASGAAAPAAAVAWGAASDSLRALWRENSPRDPDAYTGQYGERAVALWNLFQTDPAFYASRVRGLHHIAKGSGKQPAIVGVSGWAASTDVIVYTEWS